VIWHIIYLAISKCDNRCGHALCRFLGSSLGLKQIAKSDGDEPTGFVHQKPASLVGFCCSIITSIFLNHIHTVKITSIFGNFFLKRDLKSQQIHSRYSPTCTAVIVSRIEFAFPIKIMKSLQTVRILRVTILYNFNT
jgi:hypothetical protein